MVFDEKLNTNFTYIIMSRHEKQPKKFHVCRIWNPLGPIPFHGDKLEYEIIESTPQYVTLKLIIPADTNEVSIVGTSVVPEFQEIVILVLVVAILPIIVLSRKFKKLTFDTNC